MGPSLWKVQGLHSEPPTRDLEPVFVFGYQRIHGCLGHRASPIDPIAVGQRLIYVKAPPGDRVAETEEAVGELQARPRGRLRVNAPVSFGSLHLAAAIADYMAVYPDVAVELILNDRIVDPVEEGYDVAVRIARLADSNLIARRLAPCRHVVCASPGYLKRLGRPEHPADLARHNFLSYSYSGAGDERRFDGPDGSTSIQLKGTLQANNGDALCAAAVAGGGIAILPTFIASSDIIAGRLIPILTQYRMPEIAIYALYPPGRYLSVKVRSFVDFLVPRFGERPSWDVWMPATDRKTKPPKAAR